MGTVTLSRPSADKEIDLSLRLWSDRVPLAPIAERLGFRIEHLHVVGQIIPKHRGAKERVARAHYVSVAHLQACSDEEVLLWGGQILEALKRDNELVTMLHQSRVEATLWISVLGREPVEPPRPGGDLLRLAEGLNVGVLIENYTRVDADVPEKIWLTKAHLARHAAN